MNLIRLNCYAFAQKNPTKLAMLCIIITVSSYTFVFLLHFILNFRFVSYFDIQRPYKFNSKSQTVENSIYAVPYVCARGNMETASLIHFIGSVTASHVYLVFVFDSQHLPCHLLCPLGAL